MKIYVVYRNESNEYGDCSCSCSWRSAAKFYANKQDAIDYCNKWNCPENHYPPYEWEEETVE